MRLSLVCLLAVTVALTGCERHASSAASAAAARSGRLPASSATAARLNDIAEKYYDDYLLLHPLVATERGDHRFDERFGDYASPSGMADGLAIEQEALEKLAALDPKALTAEERLTFEAFSQDREINAEGYRFASELMPVDAVSNLPARFAELGSGQGAQPFRNARDYDNFLSRMDGFVAWVNQSINNMRSGIAKGVVQPRAVVERTLLALEAIEVDDPKQSVFWRPILAFPAALSVVDRQRLTRAYEERLGQQVLPAYRRLHDYLKNEYLGQARAHPGMDALPSGDLWYAYLVRYHTETSMTPAEVHELGLREVALVRAEAERLRSQAGHGGDLRSFFEAMRADPNAYYATPAELLAGYGAIRDRVGNAMPLLFAETPRARLEIRAVEPLRASSAPATAYQPPGLDGPRAGVFYVNTLDVASRPKYLMECSFLAAALPGHHFQMSLAQERRLLPRFRRVSDEAAYRDGWALYAQALGRDLGLYGDVGSYAGYLAVQLWMAARLVVDTGLHSKGWTREQAIDYLRANSGLTEAAVAADVDRSLASPGEVLAGEVGRLRIQTLRQRARETLGARFDAREFHTQVAAGGSMPLPVLEKKLELWIASKR